MTAIQGGSWGGVNERGFWVNQGQLPGGGCSHSGPDLPKYTTMLHSAAVVLKLSCKSESPGVTDCQQTHERMLNITNH